MKSEYAPHFYWPTPHGASKSVGDALFDLMAEKGWVGADAWRLRANKIAPTIVGGSKKHGGPDLGPTRAKRQWAELGVDGMGIANEPPTLEDAHDNVPRLTVRMAARIQGFPDNWIFSGKKTASYRQVGNAFPPPVARRVGEAIKGALSKKPSELAYGQLSFLGACGLVVSAKRAKKPQDSLRS
jgi:DNA (cytosine-5)-methyltransferase 1